MGGVFVNYRFDDERFGAGAVYDGLAERFGERQVFRDCVSMRAGEHYPTRLRQGLEDADILVSVIGPSWSATRLEEPGDWVRYELRRALERGIPIIPVLTDGTQPPHDLPSDIAPVALFQAHQVNHQRLTSDVRALADRVAELVPELAVRELFTPAQPLLAEQPSALLRAEHAVVRFTGRGDELDQLWRWATSRAALSAKLVTGPAGQGKTRLAQQLCARFRAEGWIAGLVRDDAPDDVLRRCAGLSTRTLLVIDYAETRVEQLLALAAALLDGTKKPVRLLMLARTGGEWLRPLVEHHHSPRIVNLFQPAAANAVELAPLLHGAAERQREFGRAVRAFSTRLRRDGGGVTTPFDLDDERYDRVLDLHAAALVALLDQTTGLPAAGDTDPIRRVLHHEYHYWDRVAAAFGLPDPHTDRLRQIAAAATLFGAADDAQARAVLSSLRTMAAQPADTVDRYLSWLKRLYPGPHSLNPMQPDRLGEDHVAATVRVEPSTATNPVPAADEDQLTQAVTVLGRASSRHEAAGSSLADLVTLDPSRLVPVGVRVVPRLENPYPLVEVLTSTVAGRELFGDLMATLAALPGRSIALADFALTAINRALAVHRAMPEPDPAIVASLLSRLASRLEENGRGVDALAAMDEAIEVYRGFAAQDNLVRCLYREALMLSRLKRHDEAAAVSAEAIELCRAAEVERAQLAQALTVFALSAGDAGRHEEALAAATEATSLYRVLAAENPADYASPLATSLSTQAIQFQGLGRPEEEEEAHAESVRILRSLAAVVPELHRSTLALFLKAEAVRLGEAGRHEEALTAAREAERIIRFLDELEPDVHRPDLGDLLILLSGPLEELGRVDEALAVLDEAVTVYRELAYRVVGAYEPLLAKALRLLACKQDDLGDTEVAIVTAAEAANLYRKIPAPVLDVHRDDLGALLRIAACWLNQLGRAAEAVDLATEAYEIYVELAGRDRGKLLDVALTAGVQAVVLSQAERYDEACEAGARAVEVHRLLPGEEDFLASALQTYALLLCNVDRLDDADARHREAVALREGDPDGQRKLREEWDAAMAQLAEDD